MRRAVGERGYVLLTMGASAIALFAALGLAVDIGRMFIAKTETQAFCDSAALAATLKLDGTTAGITAAKNAVTNNGNAWNLDSTSVTSPQTGQPTASYQVDFAPSAAGPWASNPNPATGYIFARVQVTGPVSLYFLPVVVSQQLQNVNSLGIGGEIAQTTVKRGLAPFTSVSTDKTSSNFGLVVGNLYDIQWPAFNGTRAGCTPTTPDQCFVRSACTGDVLNSKAAVTQYWGASTDGYWGSNANSTINQEVLDLIQLQTVTVNQQLNMTSGNKNAEATALDTRVNQDGDITDNDPVTYLGNSMHNARRLVALPIVNPTATGTFVIGYGAFLLQSNGNPSNYYASGNGNDPFCAAYAGPFLQGGLGVGGGSTGYYKVSLVQ